MTVLKKYVEALPLAGLRLIKVPYFQDSRGIFCQAFSERTWAETGITCRFVQDNFSESIKPWTVRGLHFQRGTSVQAKLVQVVKGAILDVVVDIRRDSSTFGQHFSIELEASGMQLFVPEGFAHGFMSLVPNTIVAYKVSQPYDPANEGGIYWADETLAIKWPANAQAIEISEKDKGLASFDEQIEQLF